MKKDGKQVPGWECPHVHRKMQLFLSVYVDDMKMAGETQNMPKMWATLRKNVDLDDPTSCFDHVNLGCTHVKKNPHMLSTMTVRIHSTLSVS